MGEAISAVGLSPAGESDLAAHLHFELTLNGEPADFTALVEN